MKRRCFSSIVPETPLSVNRKRGFSCISPHFPALPLVGRPFGEKTTFFFANAKVPPRVFKIFTARRFTPPFSCKFLLSLLLQVFLSRPADGGSGKKYDAAPEPPFPAVGGEGRARKREETESGSETKRKGRGRKKRQGLCGEGRCALSSAKNGEKKQRRPQRFWGRLCRKKPVAADRKTTRKNAIKDRFYKNPCGKPSFLRTKPYGRQGSVRGIGRSGPKRRLQRVKACGRSKKSPKRRFGLFLRGRTEAAPCKRRLLNALPRGRGFPSPDRRGKSRRCSPETPPFFTVIFTVCHRVF